MTQVSFQGRQLGRLLHNLSLQLAERFALGNALRSPKHSRARKWLISLTVLIVLLLWNWQLVLAITIGLLTMVLIYWVQQSQWTMPQLTWQRVWNRSNRQLTLAVIGGVITTLSTFMATTVWAESQNSWLAAGTILQGLGTLAVLLLLVWQRLDRSTTPKQADYHQMLAKLSDPDPLKRLITIRQITHWVSSNSFAALDSGSWRSANTHPKTHFADCFRLMLRQETEPTLRKALIDGLHVLTRTHELKSGSQALAMPAAIEQRARLLVDR